MRSPQAARTEGFPLHNLANPSPGVATSSLPRARLRLLPAPPRQAEASGTKRGAAAPPSPLRRSQEDGPAPIAPRVSAPPAPWHFLPAGSHRLSSSSSSRGTCRCTPLSPRPQTSGSGPFQWQLCSALLPIHDLTSAGTPTAAGRIAAAPPALLPRRSLEHPPLAKLLSPDMLSAPPPPPMTLPFPSLKSVPAPFVSRYPASLLKTELPASEVTAARRKAWP